jgi:acyl-coenzyme A synthetase/AMP-(fatty) acid ligase
LSGEEEFPRIRLVGLGGEVLYPQDVEMYRKHFSPDCLLSNGMGSSECPSVCNYLMDKETQIKTSTVPVGYEYEGRQVLLLDEDGRDVGINRVGRIVVKSRYLSPGYWREPGLTQAAFLPDPEGGDERLYQMGDLGLRLADGCLVHLGREDYQVKIRGYRVEVVEVEMALLALDSIKEAVVVPREDRRGDKRLVAYLEPASGSAPTVSELRRALVDRLPDFMIPSAFVMLESLPLGATGKVEPRARSIVWRCQNQPLSALNWGVPS